MERERDVDETGCVHRSGGEISYFHPEDDVVSLAFSTDGGLAFVGIYSACIYISLFFYHRYRYSGGKHPTRERERRVNIDIYDKLTVKRKPTME